MSYRTAGEGPVVALIHGITSTSDTWRELLPLLAERHTVVAPDLLGHGDSAKPRGDYSLGAYAAGLRDLLGGAPRAREHRRTLARRRGGDAVRPTSSPSAAIGWP